MPALDNIRHETFCQLLANGKTSKEAYAEAGYGQPKSIASLASQLLVEPRIVARLKEIREELAVKTGYAREKIAEMLVQDREFARELGQPAAATAATVALGKLHGHFIEKVEHKVTVTHEERMQRAQDVLIAYRAIDDHSEHAQ